MIPALTRVRFRPAAASAAATYAKPALRRASFSVLAIESSADDTGVAIVTHDRRILSNVVVKQHATHEQYGGIHPICSVRLHQRNVPGAIRQALAEAGMSASDVDAFAFTRGPGMPGSLGVGANAALSLAAALEKPVVGVHHMQAHALTPLLTSPPSTAPRFPFLTLLVSGGHTLLVLACSPTRFRILASTLDAAAGRVFDKVARMLGLGWGAMGPGAALEEFCGDMSAGGEGGEGGEDAVVFKPGVPGRLTFSFAGLQSAVERVITGAPTNKNENPAPHSTSRAHAPDPAAVPPLPEPHRRAIARAFQRAAVAQLIEKVALALEVCRKQGVPVRDVVVSGGVASNRYLRARLEEVVGMEGGVRFVFPPPALCTDNAAMIAWAAMYRLLARDTDPYTVPIKAKWSIQALAGSTISTANEAVKTGAGEGEEGEEDPSLSVPTTEGLREFYAETLGVGASEDPAAGSTLV